MLRKKACSYVLICLVVILFFTFKVTAGETSGTIFIRANGTVDSATTYITSSDNITYSFTGIVYDSIVIERDNIIVNGCGYVLQGAGKLIGMDMSERKNITVTGLEVTGFGIAFELWNSESIQLRGNRVVNNVFYGFDIWNSTNLEIINNTITHNEIGVKIEVSSSNNISNNVLSNNKIGIHFFISSGNRIYGNNFTNNTSHVTLENSGTNSWDNGYPSGGNYWSDFRVIYSNSTDKYHGPSQNQLGSDGFWDTPYIIDQINKDNYPLCLWSNTLIVPKSFSWVSFVIIIAFIILIILCLTIIYMLRVRNQHCKI